MANETVAVDRYIYQTLAGDAALTALLPDGASGIVLAPADAGMAEPFVSFQFAGAGRDQRVAGGRLVTVMLYDIKVVARGTNLVGDVLTAVDRIDALLDAGSQHEDGDTVIDCIRVSPISYPEVVDGVRYHHIGGTYRFTVQST